MAWGDIRYDHSDIFSPKPPPPAAPPKPKRVKFQRPRPPKVNKHVERRNGLLAFVESAGDRGVTVKQVKDRFGFKHASAASRALLRLFDRGDLVRAQAPQLHPELRKPPYIYKVKK